jgi:hypothetical protein
VLRRRPLEVRGERVARERAGREDHGALVGDAGDLRVLATDEGCEVIAARDLGGEALAIDGERAARGHLGRVGDRITREPARRSSSFSSPTALDSAAPRMEFEHTSSHELVAGLRGRALVGLLLAQADGDAALGELERGLAAREAARRRR